jgi:hypothetical protein
VRVPAKLWVQAYVRARNGAGAFATVVKHGDDEFGTIWIKLNRLDGAAQVYALAPEPLRLDPEPGGTERRFVCQHKTETIAEADAEQLLRRQRDFDTDLWIVEVEDRAGRHGLDDLLDRSE